MHAPDDWSRLHEIVSNVLKISLKDVHVPEKNEMYKVSFSRIQR